MIGYMGGIRAVVLRFRSARESVLNHVGDNGP
jgi:hypothetical protein